MAEAQATWHGDDEDAARARAKAIRGRVVYSWRGDRDEDSEWGYYSEPSTAATMLRTGERIVASYEG